MPQISTQEFERLPLRVNAFLAGVPLWAVDLPRTRSCITLDEFLRTAARLFTLSPVVRALKKVRETALLIREVAEGIERGPAAAK